MPDTTLQGLPPHMQLIQMGCAYWTSQMVLVAAELSLADRLAKGPRNADELARELGLNAPAFYRFMRSLAGLGILTQRADGAFALTALGEALKTGASGAARSSILMLTGLVGPAWDRLSDSLKTGTPSFNDVFGVPIFEHLAKRPDQAAMFSETMVGFHNLEPPAVAAAYDFSPFKTIVDVGGATGNMLCNILGRHKAPRGLLFDMPHVVTEAPAFIAERGLRDRISIESGSFFEAVPKGHDAYIMSHIIHDWTPEQCGTILGNCRKAIAPNGKLLIVEMVLPEGDTPHPGKMLDMMMLVGPGGQERTGKEYEALLAKSGFRMTRIVPTNSDVSVVEAVPA
ncbi:MAG: methyltransferase [Alphaproteobacteria bacterium]